MDIVPGLRAVPTSHPGKTALRTAFAFLTAIACAGTVADAATLGPSPTLPGRSDVQQAAAAVGDHYRSVVPCASGSCAINNKWDNGVLMMGVIEHWRAYGSSPYRTYAENWARRHAWTLFDNTGGRDQRNPNWHNRVTAGYTYLRLDQAGSAGASVADVVSNLDDQLALQVSPEREQLVDYVFPGQSTASFSWKAVDANFMALPTWVAMGRHTGDTRYYDRARDLQNYQVDVMGLQSPATKLWFQHEAAKTQTTANGRPIVWGRGNGWIAAGLANVLSELPASRNEYPTYRTRFTDLMESVRTRQRADGFWNMNLADANDSPAPETSATALMVYAMARGIHLGILGRDTYGPVAAKAWNAMRATAMANDGHLGFCQGVGGGHAPPPGHPAHPSESSPETNYCVGAVLLAGSAMRDITPSGSVGAARTYEAETLATTVSPGDLQQDVSSNYAGGGRANRARLSGVGDYVQFTAPSVPAGAYNLRVKLRLDGNSGIFQLTTGGVNIGPAVDGYDVSPHYAELSFGSVNYAGPATRQYRFVVTGKNARSGGYAINIDRISLFALASESNRTVSRPPGSSPRADSGPAR